MEGQKEEGVGEAAKDALAEADVEDLPKAIVRRLVKDKLAQLASGSGGEMVVNRDAVAAFAESARIFIHYLSATANDVSKESKRQTISAEDVIKALEDMEFPEFIEPLRASLQDFRSKNASRRSGKQAEKRRKLDEEPLPQEDNNAAADDDKENED